MHWVKQEIKRWKESHSINKVYGTTTVSTKSVDGHGKLDFPWVGPYIITEVIPGGAYRLQDKKMGKDESNP
jgi:hypothetical protein